MTFAPLAHVTRSGFLESVHHGSAVALDAAGVVVVRVGDPAAGVLPRSSRKPVPLRAVPRAGRELTGPPLALAAIARAEPGTPGARVAEAIRAHPEHLGGTGRDVTELIRAVPGLIAKDGAEGVYAAALPDGRAAVLKIADGSPRARQPVMLAL